MSPRPSPDTDGPPRVRMLSKPGCHLCEEAEQVVAVVCAEVGEQFEVVDVTQDANLLSSYGEQIPVTFIDGAQHDFWRVDPDRLRAALSGR